MGTFIVRRILVAMSVALTISIVSFMLLHLSGDLATSIAGPEATAEQVEQIRVDYGLDRPIVSQYLDWLGDALTFDFGRSYYYQSTVVDLIVDRMPVTLTLGGLALALAVGISIPLGVLAALKRDTWIDRLALLFAVVGQAMPSFWFGLTLIVVFAVTLQWLPAAGG